MFRTTAAALAVLTGLGASASAAAEPTLIKLAPVTTPIVPTDLMAGDRDIAGHARMRIEVSFSLVDEGRTVHAHVTFSAGEKHGDGSRTAIGPVTFPVWKSRAEDGSPRIAAIESKAGLGLILDSSPGCALACGRIVGREDGGELRAFSRPAGGPIGTVVVLGATDGDDISPDGTATGYVSVRRITFNPMRVTFAPEGG